MLRIAATLVPPTDYAELHTTYRNYVEKLVRQWGVPTEDIEDVASAILLKFYERDMLKEYDPSRGTYFGAFLYGFVAAYIRYVIEKKTTDTYREGTSVDVVVGGTVDGGDRTLYDVVAPKHYDRHEELEYVDFVNAVRQHLAFVKPSSKADKADLVAIWDLMVAQEYEHGRLQVSAIAEHFGVSLAGAKKWVARIRVQVELVVMSRR